MLQFNGCDIQINLFHALHFGPTESRLILMCSIIKKLKCYNINIQIDFKSLKLFPSRTLAKWCAHVEEQDKWD